MSASLYCMWVFISIGLLIKKKGKKWLPNSETVTIIRADTNAAVTFVNHTLTCAIEHKINVNCKNPYMSKILSPDFTAHSDIGSSHFWLCNTGLGRRTETHSRCNCRNGQFCKRPEPLGPLTFILKLAYWFWLILVLADQALVTLNLTLVL